MQTLGVDSQGEDHLKPVASSSTTRIVDIPEDLSTDGVRPSSVSRAASVGSDSVSRAASIWSGSGSPAASAEAMETEMSPSQAERIMRLKQAGLRTSKEGFTATDFEGFTRVVRPGYTQTAPEEDIKNEMFDKLRADNANPRTRELGILKGATNESLYLLNLKVERLILTLTIWSLMLPFLTLLHDFLLGPLLILTGFLSYYQVPFKPFMIFYSIVFTVMCLRYSYLDLTSNNSKLLATAELLRCKVFISFLKRHKVKRCCPFSGEAVRTKYFIIPQGTRNTAKLSVGCRVKEWQTPLQMEITGDNFSACFTQDGHVEIKDQTGAFLCKRKLMESETGPVYSFFEYFRRNERNLVCADGDLNKGVLHALSIDEILNLIVSDIELLQCETTDDILILGDCLKVYSMLGIAGITSTIGQ